MATSDVTIGDADLGVVKLEYEWRWDLSWLGWRRCLWLAFALDTGNKFLSVVFFGLHLSYGQRLKRANPYYPTGVFNAPPTAQPPAAGRPRAEGPPE